MDFYDRNCFVFETAFICPRCATRTDDWEPCDCTRAGVFTAKQQVLALPEPDGSWSADLRIDGYSPLPEAVRHVEGYGSSADDAIDRLLERLREIWREIRTAEYDPRQQAA